MALTLILTFVPIAIAAILLMLCKVHANICAIVAWIATFIIAVFLLNTPVEISLKSSLHGLVTSFPLSLMVVFSILQVTFMERVGAIKRVSVFLKTLAPQHKPSQVMMMNIGAGTLLVSVGAVPLSVLPPIMKDMGYSTFHCVAMPSIGYDALCTYSMLAAPLVTFCDLTNTSLVDAAKVFSMYLPVVSTMICFGMFALMGGMKMVKEGFVPALITGLVAGFTAFAIAHIPALESAIVLTGIIAGLLSIIGVVIYMKATKKVIIDRSVLTEEDKEVEKSMSLGKALSPWLILIVALLCVAFIPPLNEFLKVKLECPLQIMSGTVAKVRPFWNAYFWILVSTLISFAIFRPTRAQLKSTVCSWGKRAPKPAMTTAIFFGVGLLMSYTGYQIMTDGSWALVDDTLNMIAVLSQCSANAFGALYPLIVPPLGLFSGFVTSSEASALAMFAGSNLQTASLLGINGLTMAAATGIAGGVASVISPAKLMNASAAIDAIGCEADVLKQTFKIAIVLVVAVMILCMIFSKTMGV